ATQSGTGSAMNLQDLRERFVTEGRKLPAAVRRQLESDERAGAKAILKSVDGKARRNRAEGQRLRKMLRFERELWSSGTGLVAGVDEAGMSPLAGPVVAAAVILPVGCRIARVDDSKKLPAALRYELADTIRATAVSHGIGWVWPHEIDELNIYYAGLLAMKRAIAALDPQPEVLLVDGRPMPDPPYPHTPLVKGDSRSLSIAAASILAKTTRDSRMVEYDAEFPGYGLAKHKGYPVAAHKAALIKLGATPIHRRSFEAVKAVL
ncbi:MAG: ribonuclease HII, partial [Myxococcota bacterium]